MTTVKKDVTAELAESITWAGSKQTYYTAKLLVDKDLGDDFYRAYAYFRWIDDVIDVSSRSDEERSSFIERQKELIDHLYGNYRPDDLALQEQILADFASRGRHPNPLAPPSYLAYRPAHYYCRGTKEAILRARQ